MEVKNMDYGIMTNILGVSLLVFLSLFPSFLPANISGLSMLTPRQQSFTCQK